MQHLKVAVVEVAFKVLVDLIVPHFQTYLKISSVILEGQPLEDQAIEGMI